MPTPWSSTVNTIMPSVAPAAERTMSPGLEKPTAFDKQVIEDLPHARLVGDELRRVVGDRDVQREAGALCRLAHAEDRRVDDLAHVDRPELQLHGAGVHRRQRQDVVDDGEQRLRGGRDVAEVLVLLLVERARSADWRATR